MSKENILNEISNYFTEIAGADYKSITKIVESKEKQIMKERREKAEQIQDIFFNTIQDVAKNLGLIMIEHKGFLDGTRRKIKNCFWIELREETKIESPESISIFLEKPEKEIRIRVSTDIYEAKCTSDLLSKHNDIVISKCPDGFQYYLNKAGANGVIVSEDTEAKRIIDGKKNTKVQACKIFDVNVLIEDEYKLLRDAIVQLIPLYELING